MVLFSEKVFDGLMDIIKSEFRVSKKEILSESRASRVVRARYICISLYRKLTGESLPRTGAVFHRDHSTIHYAVQTAKDWYKYEKAFRSDYDNVEEELNKRL